MTHIKAIALYILSFVALALFILTFASCAIPNPKKQKKHYDKFIYYGGKIDTAKRTITVEKIVKGKDGKDSLIYVDVTVPCPEAKIDYRDRWHVRRMDKQERDSLKRLYDYNIKMEKIKSSEREYEINKKLKIQKELTKQAEAKAKEAKNSNPKGWSSPWIWVIIIGMITVSIYLIKKG